MKHLFTLSLLLLGGATANAEELFSLIDARLELMDEVAAYKWDKGIAIEDKERETTVLNTAAKSAGEHGLEPGSTRYFFQMQIEAAKQIQRYWFDRYRGGTSVGEVRDLNADIRPRLIVLGNQINAALANTRLKPADQPAFLAAIDVRGLPESTEVALFQSLLGVTRFEDRMTQIMQTGVVRVGTTGDYAPFSLTTGDGYEGIDIDMARNLAKSLGVELKLVRTSWPTLMQDLHQGKFDIGMSGISYNDERAETAAFSTRYYRGGKTPIARCETIEMYGSLPAIDRPGVRVIVNPGGTNFRFARDNIRRADLIVFDDNRTIFNEIAAGRADVMITDAIEVKLKSREIPELCAAMPGKTLTELTKAYLMPQDPSLVQYVDSWLELRMVDGTFAKIFSRYMPE